MPKELTFVPLVSNSLRKRGRKNVELTKMFEEIVVENFSSLATDKLTDTRTQ